MRVARIAVLTLVTATIPLGVSHAQTPGSVPRVVRFDGVAPAATTGARTAVLAVFDTPTGGSALWEETQIVQVDAQGHYSVLVGAGQADGLPPAALASSEPRWLEVRFDGNEVGARAMLTSVPYALRAADADTLGGLPASAFLRAPEGAAGRPGAADTAAATGTAAGSPLVNTGTTGFIGKFANTVDLTSSAMFDSGGRIGVGTTAPLDSMHVRFNDSTGAVTGYAVQNLGSSGYSGMLFYDQNGSLAQFQGFSNLSHEYRINNIAPGGSINFRLANASRFTITSSGIGINSITPADALDVAGFTRSSSGFRMLGLGSGIGISSGIFSGVTQEEGNALVNIGINDLRTGAWNPIVGGGFFRVDLRNGQPLFGWWSRAVSSGTESLLMNLSSAGALNVPGVRSSLVSASPLAVMIDSNGQLGIVSSSRRYKDDIRDMAEASAGLMALRPVTYHYRNTPEGAPLEYGLIAEEVAEVYPDLVARLDDGSIETVQYHKVNAMLLNEVQKQQRHIQEQDRRMEALTERLAALERLLASTPK